MNIRKAIMETLGITSGYEVIDKTRARDLPYLASPQPENEELSEGMLSEIVAQARHQERNNGVIGQIVLDTSIYSVGDGILPQPMTKDKAFNKAAAAAWNEWCEYPEITEKFHMGKAQDLICRSLDTDGEAFILKVFRNGRPYIQIIEGTDVRGGVDVWNKPVRGIETDDFGKPTRYNIRVGKRFVQVPASCMIHIANYHRPSSVRGLPTLQRSVGPIADVGRLTAAAKRNLFALSGISFFVAKDKHEAGDLGANLFSVDEDDDSPAKKDEARQIERNDAEAANLLGGLIMRGKPGESVTPIMSDSPGSNARGFRKELIEEACYGSIPYGVAIDPSKLGGTSARIVVHKAGRYFGRRQSEMIRGFLLPVYRWFIACQITAGKLPAVPEWWKAEGLVPRNISVDAGRDASNDREDVKAGLKPLEDIYAEQGMSFEDEVRKRAENIALIKSLADEIGVDPAVLSCCFTATAGLSAPNTTPPNNPPAPEQAA